MKRKTKRIAILAILLLLMLPVVLTKADSNQTQNTGFASPTWHNATPANNTGVAYSPGYSHLFSVDWADAINVSITHNFTGEHETHKLESQNSAYKYATELPAGTYSWKMSAEGNNGSMNQTPLYTYKVTKAIPAIFLYLNSEASNITITQDDHVNITAILEDGTGNISLTTPENEYTGKNISVSKQFTEPGHYNITLSYEATQNYTHRKITRTIIVEEKQEGEYGLLAPITDLGLGDEMEYLIKAPSPSDVTIKISRKTKFGDTYWLELIETINLENKTFPALMKNTNTKKAGEYVIEAEFHSMNKSAEVEYIVKNTLSIEIQGDTKVKRGTKTSIEATATNGISPYQYTWTLSNGTKINNRKLEVTYNSQGSYNTKLEVKDSEGNAQEQTIIIDVRNYYDLTVEVRNQDNQALKDARVTITDTSQEKWTGSDGKATFNLPSDEYRIRASLSGYASRNVDIDLDENKAITITLDKQESTSSSAASSKIQLESPENNAQVSGEETEFRAALTLGLQATCRLFIAEKESQWFVQVAEKQSTGSETISFTEKLDEGDYKWKVECTSNNENHESSIREFSVSRTAQTTTATAFDSSVIDAGELRQKLDDASDNLNSLGLEAIKAAEALRLREIIDRSMRDYERVLRDINSMQFRRDLTDAQRQEKLSEYRDIVSEIERSTPINLEVISSEEFINFPDRDDLRDIAESYKQERNLQGHLDIRELESLQGKIMVRTSVFHAKITLISGDAKEVTVIDKAVEYTGETSRNQFLIERVPSTFSEGLEILPDHDIITRNELIRFDKIERITYYANGHQSIEEAKSAYTLIISESAFKSTRTANPLTGYITFSSLDMDSTTWLVILLLLILIAYILYALDLFEKIKGFAALLWKDKKSKEIMLLVNDAKDYLETENIERATLIYKQVKMLYEKAPKPVKNNVYEESVSLANALNEKYISKLITGIHDAIKKKENASAVKLYNTAIEAYNALGEESKKSFREQMLALQKQLKNG